jgi:hypothetical protein
MIKLVMKYMLSLIIVSIIFLSCNKNNNNNPDEDYLNKEIARAHHTDFKGFYFVGRYAGNPAIYRYDSTIDKFKVFWYSPDERVIDLLISPDYKSAYFLTKRKQRLKSSQPAIEQGRLYRIDIDVNKVEPITRLEEGIQVIPFWTDDDRFTLVINSIDKTIASYVNKNTQVYNRFGKLLSDNTEVFDLTKDGYPITKLPSLNYTSPNNLFTVSEKKDSIILTQQKFDFEIKTNFTSKKIIQLGWAENNKQLILVLKSVNNPEQNAKEMGKNILAVYNLQKKKTAKIFDTGNYNHFVLIGDFLIFDNDFDKDSYIEIFNLESLSNFRSIKINGGCNLRNI